MILGIGTDLVNIERVKRILDKYGDRFRDRVFTLSEKSIANTQKNKVRTYANRWAAKEAFLKALGTGLTAGISWQDISVTNNVLGKPILVITGLAEDRLKKITPQGHDATIHISLTDDHPWAQAFVIIESQPSF